MRVVNAFLLEGSRIRLILIILSYDCCDVRGIWKQVGFELLCCALLCWLLDFIFSDDAIRTKKTCRIYEKNLKRKKRLSSMSFSLCKLESQVTVIKNKN